ncbi:MAG: hypothetical protein HKN76_06545, partial [Saprospiraceae bacterium]|nr:hypothetical protein [Saprospiraceae bacterium]
MNNLENIHAIEKYFDQRLSEQEMEDLEVRLLTDPMFRHEFETFRILKQGIIFSARRTTLSQKIERLKTWNGGAKENTKIKSTATKGHILRSRIKRMAPWAIAVSLLFLLSIPILMPEPTTPKQLFAKYFEPSPNFGPQPSRNVDPNIPAQEAYLAYDLGDYELAASLFETHLKQDSSC